MKASLIYSVTVTTLYYLYMDEPREYSSDKTEISCEFDSRSSLFLSFEAAEKRKNDVVTGFHGTPENRLFSVCIDEYEEGEDITVKHPKRAWYYDCEGKLVKELVRIGLAMVFASKTGLPSIGDIVEIPTSSPSVRLGIIAWVPRDRTDYIGNLNSGEEPANYGAPYDPRCYIILTEKAFFYFNEYESVDFMPYTGQRGKADFMKEFLETYKRQNQ